MQNDTERLFVLVEARISEFEKRMKQAERRGTQTYSSLRRGSQSATRAMEADMTRASSQINAALATTSARVGAVSAAFRGFIAGAAVTALGVAVSKVGDIARGMAEIGDEAKRAGVSAEAFQEWKFVAEQNRIAVDSMIDGLKELNLRADEFVVTGSGPAAEAFARLGYSSEELARKLKDPSELMLEIIDRLGQMDKAAQIRIADEVFGGTAGERFVELLGQGEDGIRRTIDRAHELGIVLDQTMIDKAAEIDRRFNEISNTVGMTLKSAIVSAADSLADFMDGLRALDDQRSVTLERRVNEILTERAQILERIGTMEGSGKSDRQKSRTGSSSGVVETLRAQVDELTAEEDRIIAILSERTSPASDWSPQGGSWTPPATSTTGGRKPSSGARGGSRSRDDFADRLQRLQESLMSEREILDAWYSESQDILLDQRTQELVGEQNQKDALLSLEQEYQDRLRAIRAMGNEDALAEASSFFGSMAAITAAGGNRLVKATQIFGAVEAAINVYRAQAQVLADPTLGFFAKMAAYAQIGAAGGSVVAAIKGAGSSSRARTSGGSTRSAPSTRVAETKSQPERPLDVRLTLAGFSPDQLYSGDQISKLLDALTKEAGTRGIRLIR